MMKGAKVFRLVAAIGFTSLSFGAFADTITQWDFNGSSSTTVPGGSSSPSPLVGSGSASLLGAPTGGFNSGVSNGGSSDPVTTSPPNFGWQTTPYAVQGSGSGENGVTFEVSTVGYSDISVRFDTRHSNTSSKWVRFDYSNDGGLTWVPGTAASGTIYEATAGDTWYNMRTADLSADSNADNNANFRFRMVSVFGPQTGPFVDGSGYTQYWSSNPASTYAATGTLRWDMVTVSGTSANQTATITGYVVDQGINFGGSIASLVNSDDDRVIVLCDESDSNGRVIVTANSPVLAPASVNGTFETRASRNDLSQFTRILNSTTSIYEQIDFRTSSLIDVVYNTSTPGANHVAPNGDIVYQINWIPQADIDAGDGWTMSIDQIAIALQ